MELHPDETLLQELQAIHETGMMPHQKGTCYDIRKQYKKNPQTGGGVRKPTKTKKPTEMNPCIHTTVVNAELSTTTHGNSKQNLTPTATKITLRAPSLLKKAINMNNSKHSEEEHPTSSERLKCQFNDCNKTFAKKDYLRKHTMKHTNTRTFKCNFERCDKKFNRSDTLSRHRRAHFQTALFECPECHKNFSRLDNLARHISTKHRSQLK